MSPISVLLWHEKRCYLLFCGHQSGDLHILTMSGSMKCTDIQTSTFGGYIHSLSLSPTSSRIAIAYGNEIALTNVILNPYRLKDHRECLPKPPSSPHGPSKSGGPVAKSLRFMRKKNHLVVTYTGHGIVIWDLLTVAVIGEIAPRTFPIGRSVIAMDEDTMAVSNQINGVDWYSLSGLAFLSTTKLPADAVFHPSSGLTYTQDGASVVLGGANGSAYILSREGGVKRLQHAGNLGIVQSAAFAPAVRGRASIAVGIGGLNESATVAVWTYTEKGMKSRFTLVTIRHLIPAGLTWNNIVINCGFLFLCCAWLAHFLIGESA